MTDSAVPSALPVRNLLGLILSRAIVPLWVLTGALFKLINHTPKLLPQNIWETAAKWDFDLYWLLAILIAIELIFVGVMFFLPKLARGAGLTILGIFILVLISEIAAGHTNCGCLGSYSPSPWIMLAIDGAMFLGLLLLPPPNVPGPLVRSGHATVFGMWVLGALCITGAFIIPLASDPVDDEDPEPKLTIQTPDENGGDPEQISPPPPPQPTVAKRPNAYISKTDDWVGKRFTEIDLAQWVKGWPADLNNGPQYVIFYSRTCDHCQALLDFFFSSAPPAPTTIVAIPESRDGFATSGILEHHCDGCTELELPTGTEWMMTPPIVVALQDGVVKCAAEAVDTNVDLPQCLIFHQ